MPTHDMLQSEGPPYQCLVCRTGQIPDWGQYTVHLNAGTHTKKVFNLPMNGHVSLSQRLEQMGLGPRVPAPEFAADDGDFPTLGSSGPTAVPQQPPQQQAPRSLFGQPAVAASSSVLQQPQQALVDRRTQSERSGNVRLAASLDPSGRMPGQPRFADVPKSSAAEAMLREFRSGKSQRLAHQQLNEYCVAMRGSVEYLPTAPTSARLGFAFYVRVTLGGVAHDYESGEAGAKQKAKEEAARNALTVIAQVGGDAGTDGGGGASQMASDTASLASGGGGVGFSSDGLLPGNRYMELCERRLQALLVDAQLSGAGRVAAIFVSDSRHAMPAVELVAVATGSGCIDLTLRQVYESYGERVIDSTALTAAKRALRIRLAQEVSAFVAAGGPTEAGWLEAGRFSNRLRLKANLGLHLFLSAPPEGDCAGVGGDRGCSLLPPAPEDLKRDRSGVLEPDLTKAGFLGCYEDSTCTAMHQFTEAEAADAGGLAVHCGSDKLLMANYVGLQGGLLASFIEPVFLQSVDVVGGYSHGDMARGFLCRAPDQLRQRMPGPAYQAARDPWLGGTTSPRLRLIHQLSPDAPDAVLSLNWYQPAAAAPGAVSSGQVEVVQSYSGQKDLGKSQNVASAERQSDSKLGVSRLSKFASLRRVVQLAEATVSAARQLPPTSQVALLAERIRSRAEDGGAGGFTGVTLRQLKCEEYAGAKRLVAEELATRGCGVWAAKGSCAVQMDPADFALQ